MTQEVLSGPAFYGPPQYVTHGNEAIGRSLKVTAIPVFTGAESCHIES